MGRYIQFQQHLLLQVKVTNLAISNVNIQDQPTI